MKAKYWAIIILSLITATIIIVYFIIKQALYTPPLVIKPIKYLTGDQKQAQSLESACIPKNNISELEQAPSGSNITLDGLENESYFSPEGSSGNLVQLKNGSINYGIGEHGFEGCMFLEDVAYGDLNNDGKTDAAVIITENGGGSGFFKNLEVMLNENGNPKYTDSVAIGDRTHVNSLKIEKGVVRLNITTWPNQKSYTLAYKLVNNRLVQLAGPKSF